MLNEDDPKIKKWANQVERSSWLLIFFGMLSQISTEYAFPSYNVVLGFWGAYCAFSKQARATFCYVVFCFLGILFDIIFCSVNNDPSPAFQFALVMLIFALLNKAYCVFAGVHFFSTMFDNENGNSNFMAT